VSKHVPAFQPDLAQAAGDDSAALPLAARIPPLAGRSRRSIRALAQSPGLKRWIDALVAGAFLVLSFPLLCVCGLLIRLDSPGPVLFRQTRIGRNFRPFSLLKFRTMFDGPEGPAYALSSDPRVTPLGRWLRRLKIDEFPQFWNVLRGDMSLVGPRPVVPEVAGSFPREYAELLRARPGLTDPASLKYLREDEILSQASDPQQEFLFVVTPDKLRISRSYLRTATAWSDCRILIDTARALLTGTSPGSSRPDATPPAKPGTAKPETTKPETTTVEMLSYHAALQPLSLEQEHDGTWQ
jgi:lipopolysaccharide/colanic/teichoic acid biosynthesis glycosyltransferase